MITFSMKTVQQHRHILYSTVPHPSHQGSQDCHWCPLKNDKHDTPEFGKCSVFVSNFWDNAQPCVFNVLYHCSILLPFNLEASI